MIKLGRIICSICYHNLPIAALYLVNGYHFENGGGGAVSTVPAVITVAVKVWVLPFFQLYCHLLSLLLMLLLILLSRTK